MRSWPPYRQCTACTPHSTRCWFTSSLAHPDTSPLVGKPTGSLAGTKRSVLTFFLHIGFALRYVRCDQYHDRQCDGEDSPQQ